TLRPRLGSLFQLPRGHPQELPVGRVQPRITLRCRRVSGLRDSHETGHGAGLPGWPCARFIPGTVRRMIRSVVCFFAHPDDETVMAGGIIALLTQQHIPVRIVCATRGEGGEASEEAGNVPRETLGRVREAELHAAARHLGASAQCLDYIDPTVGLDDVL